MCSASGQRSSVTSLGPRLPTDVADCAWTLGCLSDGGKGPLGFVGLALVLRGDDGRAAGWVALAVLAANFGRCGEVRTCEVLVDRLGTCAHRSGDLLELLAWKEQG